VRRLAYLAISLLTATAILAVGASPRVGDSLGTQSSPAHWKPWLLSSASQFRLGAPPAAGSAQTKAELTELLRLQKTRTPAVRALIEKWDEEPAAVPWTRLALAQIQNYRPDIASAARALAILDAGMYDALIAAEDSRDFYSRSSRPAPWRLDRRLKPAAEVAAGSPSTYAPDEAAVAGAAEKILAYLFPNEPKRTFTTAANEAIEARLFAGLNYRSDLERARALGQRVAVLAIARGESDGHKNTGYSEGPFTGEQYWVRTPLSPTASWEPAPPGQGAPGSTAGTWKPWLLSDPRALWNTIAPPSPYGSPEFLAQVQRVLRTSSSLTDSQRQIASFWDDGSGTVSAPGHWQELALQLIDSYKVSGPVALKALAYLGAAENDAVSSAFGLAYHHWQVRPITAIWRLRADGTLTTDSACEAAPSTCPYRNKWYPFIETPQFPDYPSAQTAVAGLGAKLLTYFFPKVTRSFNRLADQMALSRLYAGVDFPEEDQQGLVLGRALADAYIQRAKTDG
jgi:hypothetical protein